jgi:lipopolysaccharide biosynthesis protein
MTDICLFAHYDRHDRLADHVLYYLKALRCAGFDITVISTARLGSFDKGKLAAAGVDLILRDNAGLDFGSWAAGLARLRDSSGRLQIDGRLLLANDSVYGPIGDLSEALTRMLSLPGDVHGMVESREIAPHLQSWFLVFSPNAYRSRAFEAIFGQNFAAMPKSDVIKYGEIGLSRDLRAAGLRIAALAGDPPQGGAKRLFRSNPSHLLWRPLIERDGVPFIKVELLRDNPAKLASVAGWEAAVLSGAPDLLELILVHLQEQCGRAARSRKSRIWPAISHEAFVMRDDDLARRGKRPAMHANRLVWVTLREARLALNWLRQIADPRPSARDRSP